MSRCKSTEPALQQDLKVPDALQCRRGKPHKSTTELPFIRSTSRPRGGNGSLLSRRMAARLLAAFPVAVSSLVSTRWSITGNFALAQSADEPQPDFDRLIPDDVNTGWAELGQRHVKGVVYHRMEGTAEGTDEFFRTGVSALVDYGIDNVTGELWRWNDALGVAHPELGVSANRAPFANGPVLGPSADTAAFIADNDNDAINRDQVSISIAGLFDDPISDDCFETIAALTAYFANYAAIPWDVFPSLPDKKSYGFVRWHNEIASTKACPGSTVMNATPDIIARSRDLLRQIQEGS
jgi:N-acetylmuramoyl-L-alanine amidase